VHDVVALPPVTLLVERVLGDRDIHVMPRRSLLSLTPDLVRPARHLGVGDVGICAEQFCDCRPCFGRQMTLRARDGLLSLLAGLDEMIKERDRPQWLRSRDA
jgi:hypothetical protein